MRTKSIQYLFTLLIGLQLIRPLTAVEEGSGENEADFEITVTATRTERRVHGTPGTISVITSDGFSSWGAGNAGDLIKYEPLVSIPFDYIGSDGLIPYKHGGYTSYNIRGIEGNRILLSVDGIRLPEEFVQSGGSGRDYFDPEIFGRMEIFKSAASNLYGSDALGGLVDLRTLEAGRFLEFSDRPVYLGLKAGYNSANASFSGVLTGAVEQGGVKTFLRYVFREGEEMDNNSDVPPNPEDFTGRHLFGVVEFQLNERNHIKITGEHFTRDVTYQPDSAEVNRFGGFFVITKVEHEDQLSRQRLSVEHEFNGVSTHLFNSLKSRIYYQDSGQDTHNTQEGMVFGFPRSRVNSINFRTELFGGNIQAGKSFSWDQSEHLLSYGLEFSKSRISNEFHRENLPPAKPGTEDRIGMAPSEVLRFGFYLQDELYLGSKGRLSLIPGLRADYYRIDPENPSNFLERTQGVPAVAYDDWSFAPKLGVLYQVTEEWNIWTHASMGFRNPTASEFSATFTHGTDFIVVPNPDLEEERVLSFEIGSKTSTAGLEWQLAFFYDNYSNFLESFWDTGEDTDLLGFSANVLTTVNRGDVVIYGFELGGSADLGHYNSQLEGLQLGFTSGLAGGRNQTENDWLDSVEPFKSSLHLSYRQSEGKFGARVSSTFLGEKHRVPSTASYVPKGATIVDLSGFVELGRNLTITGGLNNLLDERYNLWSDVRRGGHGGSGGADRQTRPGLNGWLSLNLRY